MKDPIFLRRANLLQPEAACYWKDQFYRVTKIGTELEVAPPKGCPRPEFEAAIREDLAPSGNFERLGPNGVLDVSTEHCGIEVRIIGRQPHFHSLQKQYSGILGVIHKHGGRIRPTCGLHYHLLTPGLGEPVPEIILANLWNLVRRYAPELRFITSGGESRQALCRRRNPTSHLEMVRQSPANLHMAEIQANLRQSRLVEEHQNFLNLEHLQFPSRDEVLPFHLEFRFPDADLSVTSVTAKTFLLLALTMKAVDLSQYGVIHVGKIAPWRRKTYLLGLLSNNDGDLATSDTSAVTDEIIEELRLGCYELLDLLAPAFEWFHDGSFVSSNPALEVLLSLAERPISLLRCAGYDWDSIEVLLSSKAKMDHQGLDDIDRRLMQRIEVGEWAGLPGVESWQWFAARELCLTPQDLERRLGRLRGLRGLHWDPRLGKMAFSN